MSQGLRIVQPYDLVAELEALFNLDYHFKHVDTIFERVFG